MPFAPAELLREMESASLQVEAFSAGLIGAGNTLLARGPSAALASLSQTRPPAS
jgi:hypothetical protein